MSDGAIDAQYREVIYRPCEIPHRYGGKVHILADPLSLTMLARLSAKAPAAFRGKSAWSTPLRATNRVLAGPFKTAGEAQAFVNTVGKAGISAFVFTSEAGQKVTKLP